MRFRLQAEAVPGSSSFHIHWTPASMIIQGVNISEIVQIPSYHQLKTLPLRGVREEMGKTYSC